MKTIIIYSSKSGNTKYLAEGIAEVFPATVIVLPLIEAPAPETLQEYDFVALGYWVDKGTADTPMAKYIQQCANVQLGLFGTMGASPTSQHGVESKKMVESLVPQSTIVHASFLCQGKIDPKVLAYMDKIIPKEMRTAPQDIRLEEAEQHPNKDDIHTAKIVFAEALTCISTTKIV